MDMTKNELLSHSQRFLAAFAPKLWAGRPTITEDHLAAYMPPPTDAKSVNPWNGEQTAITSESALILFSTALNVKNMLPLVKKLDPNTRVFDGQGIVCPQIQYGKDGRQVYCVQGILEVNGVSYPYQAAFGILIAAGQWGSSWNAGHQPPYHHLTGDVVSAGDVQIDWTS